MAKSNALTPIDPRDTKYIHSGFKFASGYPVPDGVAHSEITLENHPSNIAAFLAEDLKEATAKAIHAFRHGRQGAVWLANQSIPFVEDDVFLELDREIRVETYIQGIKAEFTSLQNEHPMHSMRFDHRREPDSSFDLHADNVLVNMPATLRSPKLDVMRVLFNIAGQGSVIFGRNILVAVKLQVNNGKFYEKISPEELGPAYIAPAGSVTFVLGGDAGLANGLLHSPPEDHVVRGEKLVRELLSVDYFLKP